MKTKRRFWTSQQITLAIDEAKAQALDLTKQAEQKEAEAKHKYSQAFLCRSINDHAAAGMWSIQASVANDEAVKLRASAARIETVKLKQLGDKLSEAKTLMLFPDLDRSVPR